MLYKSCPELTALEHGIVHIKVFSCRIIVIYTSSNDFARTAATGRRLSVRIHYACDFICTGSIVKYGSKLAIRAFCATA